jgi:hypothetical protein
VSSIDEGDGDDRGEHVVEDLSVDLLLFDIVPLSDGLLRFDIVHESLVETSEAFRFDMVLEYSPPTIGRLQECHWSSGAPW